MNSFQYGILRAITGIVIGGIFALWPDLAVIYLVILVGIFFLVPGVYNMVLYWVRSPEPAGERKFPIDSAGSILLGLILICMPAFFIHILMYILGALLVVGAIHQGWFLFSLRKGIPVSLLFYLFPVLLLTAGIVILAWPFETISTAWMFFGIAGICYGLIELFYVIRFRSGKE